MNDLIHTAGEGVDSTIIQCVHEQSLTGICIFPVLFASNGSPMYKSLTKTKQVLAFQKSWRSFSPIPVMPVLDPGSPTPGKGHECPKKSRIL